jgi:hypothetical protein
MVVQDSHKGLAPRVESTFKMGTTPQKSGTSFLTESMDEALRAPRTPAETKSSQNVTQPAANIFGSDAELGRRADAVESNLNQQGAAIQVLNDVTQVAQAGARSAMERQVAETRRSATQIVEGTTELRKKVMPVFQARGRVADQLDKINTMNPLERGIRGIFDLNYDRDYLGGSTRSL